MTRKTDRCALLSALLGCPAILKAARNNSFAMNSYDFITVPGFKLFTVDDVVHSANNIINT